MPKLQQCKQSGGNKIINIIILSFSAQICLKMDLWLENEKINVGIRISILTIPLCDHFPAKQTTLTFLAQICPKIDFGVGITMCANFQAKQKTLNFST